MKTGGNSSHNTAFVRRPAGGGKPPAARAPATDEELVRQVVESRDQDAFGMIVERYEKRLMGVARRYGRCEDDANDIMQDALINAWKKLDTYRAEAALPTWLSRLVRNSGWDWVHRRPGALDQFFLEDEDGHNRIEDLPGDANGPTPYDISDIRMLLTDALALLPPEQQQALVLVDWAGMSVSDAAAIGGVSPGTIKSRRHRAREVMKTLVTPPQTQHPSKE